MLVEDGHVDLGDKVRRNRVRKMRHRKIKQKGTKERARVVEDSPEKEVVAGGHGGAPGVRVRGLGAGCSREWGQTKEGRPGFK